MGRRIVVAVAISSSGVATGNGSFQGRFFLRNAPRIRPVSVAAALAGIHCVGGVCGCRLLVRVVDYLIAPTQGNWNGNGGILVRSIL